MQAVDICERGGAQMPAIRLDRIIALGDTSGTGNHGSPSYTPAPLCHLALSLSHHHRRLLPSCLDPMSGAIVSGLPARGH